MGGKNFRGYAPTLAEDVWTIGGLQRILLDTGRVQNQNQAVYEIVVAKWGSDTLGDGTWLAPFLTVTKAMTMVDATRKTIILGPGGYPESGLAWSPTITGVHIMGMGGDPEATYIYATDGDEVLLVKPALSVAGSNFQITMSNMSIYSAASGVDGIKIEDSLWVAGEKKILIVLRNVSIGMDDEDDLCINESHTIATTKIKLYVSGIMGMNYLEGVVYLDPQNGDDRVKISGMTIEWHIQTTDDGAVGCQHEYFNCILIRNYADGDDFDAKAVGGNAAHEVRAIGCVYRAAPGDEPTYGAATKADFAPTCDYAGVVLVAETD